MIKWLKLKMLITMSTLSIILVHLLMLLVTYNSTHARMQRILEK